MESRETDPPREAIVADAVARRLIGEMARLCALANVGEESAIEMLRAGFYATASADCGAHAPRVDPLAASQVLSEWHENLSFLTQDGDPASLSLRDGGFERLCDAAMVKSDVTDVLELLTQAEAVRRDGDFVTATRRELIVGENHPAGVARAVRILGDLASTFSHNLTRRIGEPGRFERSVASSKLSPRQLPALLAYLSIHGQSFLEDLDSWMAARKDEDPNSTIGVGVYLFVEEKVPSTIVPLERSLAAHLQQPN
jgi:hypothetical protein